MNRTQLLAAASRWAVFEEPEASYFVSLFTERSYKRNELLLREGVVAHHLFFVLEGVVRQYFFGEDGVERTCNLTLENEFLTDLESFSSQAPANTNIVAMGTVRCMVAGCAAVAEAIRTYPAISDFFRTVVERVAEGEIRRTKSMLALSPDRRFEALIQSNPEIVQRVPQRYIAQYLGIAPESLSRIRRRLMSKQKS